MSIFQTELTLRWALLAKSLRDGGMASNSARPALGKATSLPGARDIVESQQVGINGPGT